MEGTHASSFVDGHSPTVGVNVRIATSAFESSVDSGRQLCVCELKMMRWRESFSVNGVEKLLVSTPTPLPKGEVEIRWRGAVHSHKPFIIRD